jgi:hypothetical protein
MYSTKISNLELGFFSTFILKQFLGCNPVGCVENTYDRKSASFGPVMFKLNLTVKPLLRKILKVACHRRIGNDGLFTYLLWQKFGFLQSNTKYLMSRSS